MFSILNEIGNNSHFRTSSVVIFSIGTAAATYCLVAITGYLSFGNSVGGNVVNMYAPSVSSTIGRAAIVILVMFSYPLQVHPCRASIDAVMKWRPGKLRSSAFSSATSSPPRDIPLIQKAPPKAGHMSDTRFAAITTIIIILSYIVAMTVSSLEAVLAYVGSTGSTAISFILPGLFYYKISDPESPHHQRLMKADDDEAYSGDEEDGQESEGLLSGSGLLKKSVHFRRDLLRKLSLALAIYGFVVMFVCLVTNTYFLSSR